MNLAQLAKAMGMSVDDESMNLMSTVNINLFVSALNQQSEKTAAGEQFISKLSLVVL